MVGEAFDFSSVSVGVSGIGMNRWLSFGFF